MQEILRRENERGLFKVVYLTEAESIGDGAGLYANLDYRKSGEKSYSWKCGSYHEAAAHVFEAFGQVPEYAKYL